MVAAGAEQEQIEPQQERRQEECAEHKVYLGGTLGHHGGIVDEPAGDQQAECGETERPVGNPESAAPNQDANNI